MIFKVQMRCNQGLLSGFDHLRFLTGRVSSSGRAYASRSGGVWFQLRPCSIKGVKNAACGYLALGIL